MKVQFELNGKPVEADVLPRTHLADCIRHQFMQTGTHVGCEHGVCGACTIIVDGAAVRSCLMLAVQADGTRVTTVEGISHEKELTPLHFDAAWKNDVSAKNDIITKNDESTKARKGRGLPFRAFALSFFFS